MYLKNVSDNVSALIKSGVFGYIFRYKMYPKRMYPKMYPKNVSGLIKRDGLIDYICMYIRPFLN